MKCLLQEFWWMNCVVKGIDMKIIITFSVVFNALNNATVYSSLLTGLLIEDSIVIMRVQYQTMKLKKNPYLIHMM